MVKMAQLSYLGLALRAGKLTIGRYATINGCKNKKVRLVLFAHDASEKLQREITPGPILDRFIHFVSNSKRGIISKGQ